MKLSLMLINLLTKVYLDDNFRPLENPDINGYERALKLAHDAGYKAIDLTDMDFKFGTATVKSLMEKYCLSCGSVILFENFTAIDPAEQARIAEHTHEIIDAANVIGGKTMMLVAPEAVSGLTRDELKAGLVHNLSDAAEYASQYGITICIEDFPSMEIPMCAIEDIRYLLDNIKGLKLTYDSANMLVEGSTEAEFFEAFKSDIGYCHLKDVRIAGEKDMFGDMLRDGRKMIGTYHGEGIIDLKAAIENLESIGYDNYMAVEYAFDGKTDDVLDILIAEREYLENLV